LDFNRLIAQHYTLNTNFTITSRKTMRMCFNIINRTFLKCPSISHFMSLNKKKTIPDITMRATMLRFRGKPAFISMTCCLTLHSEDKLLPRHFLRIFYNNKLISNHRLSSNPRPPQLLSPQCSNNSSFKAINYSAHCSSYSTRHSRKSKVRFKQCKISNNSIHR
jgi:hypothetical protein